MKVKNRYGAGAIVVFAIPNENITMETTTKLVLEAFPSGFGTVESEFERKKISKIIFEGKDTALDYYPNAPNSRGFIEVTVNQSPALRDSIRYDNNNNKRIICFTSYLTITPLDKIGRVNLYLSLMRNVFDCFEPEFGWGCLYDDLYYDFEGDPRKRIWGINYYGKEFIKIFGKENLLSLKEVYRVEERPWGGMILQLTENPFVDVPLKLKEEVARKLKIEEAIG
ncbi:MAG: hypothetical protein AB1798_13795 [Spirochaetota bacterium]